MAMNIDLVSITTTFLVLYLSSLDTGNGGVIRRDVPPIALPIMLQKPKIKQAHSTNITNSTKSTNSAKITNSADSANSTNSITTTNSTNSANSADSTNSTNRTITHVNGKIADNVKDKNCSIEVVAFIPLNGDTNKTNVYDTTNTEPKKIVHDSYPNPPVPTPPSPTLITTTKPAEVTSEPETNDDGTKKWGFDDKYLASQNKYATRRNVVFDVVAGDAMAFSNYNVLGHQEVTLQRKK
ncbi:uncharacterized protein LOC116295990 [Actinia tenebrosa]|uniref:Uncharacterized protein LOC116295990 n=1 Tax=Actinia tenebrosa TaxID=6105 RepID=A0A6P8HWR4_ACTTE|nr:uncharacterized protein LOC116295990 [Actinia tenebrosa]